MFFWVVLGALIGAGFYWLATNKKGITFKWYEWVMIVVAVLLLLFTIQNYQASIAEIEPRAANIFLLLFGLPAVILGAIPVVLNRMRARKVAA